MLPLLQNISLAEKQRLYYNGSHCVYCGNPTEYVDSIAVYRESYGMIYLCRSCGAWVNTHNGSTDQSFGFVARKDLRELRNKVHKIFDPLWLKKVQMGGKKRASQAAARFWLAKRMDLDVVETHIGMFDNEQCLQAIEICKELYLTPEQVKKIKSDIKYRIDTVYFLSGDLDFGVTEFNINGKIQLEIKNRDGRILYFNPTKNECRWSNKKKPFQTEDIEALILTHFKENEDAQR